jgi:bifunctional enzyme CysN/CysC
MAARIVVAGHVDHGKSTLIGRLMYDLGALHESKVEEVVASSARRGLRPEWSYVLDSLQEERDQAITIDTTRLWFTHAGRRYVIIDAPGHRQFLANMLSGASEADAAILVVDASAGIEDQTLRHAYLLGFLGIRHVIVAVNKIDLVDDAESRFGELTAALRNALGRTVPVAIVPISASHGDNIVARSDATAWYDGPTIADALAGVRRTAAPLAYDLRLPVQDVYRRAGTRIAVGTIASGTLAAGEELVLAPAGERVRVEELVRWPEGPVPRATAGETVGVVLDGDRFVGRGDVLGAIDAPLAVTRALEIEVFWLDAEGPRAGERLRLKRGTQDVSVVVSGVPGIYEIEAAGDEHGSAQHNLVRLPLRASAPVAFDRREDDAVGSRSVLLRGDRVVAIGFTVDTIAGAEESRGPVMAAEREERAGHTAAIVWLTGLSGAGKTTIARAVERRLFDRAVSVTVLDGDTLRGTLNADLGFSEHDRAESVRRASAVAGVLADAGHVVLVSLIAPFAADRAGARRRARHPFFEVYVDASLDACERRDPKGLYRRARAGELPGFTGIGSPYEPPETPDLAIATERCTVDGAAARLAAFILERTAPTRI